MKLFGRRPTAAAMRFDCALALVHLRDGGTLSTVGGRSDTRLLAMNSDKPLFEAPKMEMQRDPSLAWWLPLVVALTLVGIAIDLMLR